jgi:hypothetical protein
LLFCGCTVYTNPLRPLAGVLRARRGRKFFEILKKMIPEMINNLVPVIFFVVIVMVLCSIFFDVQVQEFQSTAYTFYNWLFLVLTNDTFDRLLPENLFLNLTYLMFFFPCIYVGQRFLFNLIIGDTYDTFRSYVKKQLKKEKLKELQGLTKAFSVLDIEKSGRISDSQWTTLISKLYPELSEEALALYFELISGGNPNITILQFLSLRSVLSFNLSYTKESSNFILSFFNKIYHHIADYYQECTVSVPEKLIPFSEKLLKIADDYQIWVRVNQLDLIILSLEYSNFPILSFREKTVINACQLLLSIHLVEFFLRLIQERGKISKVSEDLNIISTFYVIGCMGSVVYYVFTSLFGWYFTQDFLNEHILFIIPFVHFQFTGIKVLMSLRLLRCVRLANYSEELKNFNAALFDILPSLVETFIFTFIVAYMFGNLGNILFGAHLPQWETPILSIVKAQQLTFMVSFLSSMEEAMQSLNPIVAVAYFVTFLISSLTVSNIALSIIIDLHANVLDMKSKKERDSYIKKMDLLFNKIIDQARCRRIFRTDLPPLNFKNIKLSSFQSSDVRHFIANDSNENKQYSFNLDELQSCQKYSNIDLMKFYNECHRIHRDVNWEINFIKSLDDLSIHEEKIYPKGETIFSANTPANHLYLLVSGHVLLKKERSMPRATTPQNSNLLHHQPHHLHFGSHHPQHYQPPLPPTQENSQLPPLKNSTPRVANTPRTVNTPRMSITGEESKECIIFATKFIGSESLVPNQVYSTTCISQEDSTKVLIFKSEDIAHDIDTDLLGSIMQMAYKSATEIENQFKEKITRTILRRMSSGAIRVNPTNLNAQVNIVAQENDADQNSHHDPNSRPPSSSSEVDSLPPVDNNPNMITPVKANNDQPEESSWRERAKEIMKRSSISSISTD